MSDFKFEIRDAKTGRLLTTKIIDQFNSGESAIKLFRRELRTARSRFPGVELKHNVPVIKHLDAKVLAAIERARKTADRPPLHMSTWHQDPNPEHWCGTAHCRSGWAEVVALRETGVYLGRDSEVNGHLIYAASRPRRKLPNFYCGDADAMKSLTRDASADPLPPGQGGG